MTPREIRKLVEKHHQIDSLEGPDYFGSWWSKHVIDLDTRNELDARSHPNWTWAEILVSEVTDDNELEALWARYQLEKES